VRSHAKASSAGSNSGPGASRGSFRRSGALAALLVALTAAACLLPGSASAIEVRSLAGSFGPDGTEGSSFSYVGPLAFDKGKKRLFALDQPAHKIYGFDASTPGSHTELGGSFPLTEPAAGFEGGIAVDSSSHDIYLASKGGPKLLGYDETGAPLPGFPVSPEGGFKGACGVAVDTAGHVWVADGPGGRVYEYSSTGTPIDSFPFATGLPCRIAVDSEENLFVANYFAGPVKKYTAASGYAPASATVVDPEANYAIALDHSTGELYVVHEESIAVFDEAGTLLYEFGGGIPGAYYYGEFGGIAIDEASEEVYVSAAEFGKIYVFGPPLSLPKTTTEGADGIGAGGATVHGTINPRSQAVEDCHFEVIPASQYIATKYENVTAAQKYPCIPAAGSIPVDANPHAVNANVTGLNPATVYHYRLAAKNSIGEGAGFDRQFTTGPAAPLVEEESVETVGTSEATVSAKINPRGGETTYHVEYGMTNAYGQSTTESAPFGFSSDNGKHPVSVHIGGLEPGTAYHFRFIAGNEVDTTEGDDATFATYPSLPTFASCPNDRFRTGPGSRLPDCRAYEQGTPIDKHGANAQFSPGPVSPSGNHFTFVAKGGLPTSGGLSNELAPFLASRGTSGWSFDGFLPATKNNFFAELVGANEDLSRALVLGEGAGGVGSQFLLRNSDTATFQPWGPVFPRSVQPRLVGFDAGGDHAVFSSTGQLLPDAVGNAYNLYDLDQDGVTLVDRIPAGSATSCDDEAGPACLVAPKGVARFTEMHRASRDGSRVFFTADPTEEAIQTGRIYLREEGVRTTWISASQRTAPDPGGEKPARLAGITSDGSTVFFLSCEKLTDDSTASSTGENSCGHQSDFESIQGNDLYSYDVETGGLTDLTVDSNVGDPLGAAVQDVVGVSEDGSYVYFRADGVLAQGASHGNCLAFSGKCNLYVYHDGVTALVVRLPTSNSRELESRVSADGRTFVFRTAESLTGYDNVTEACGAVNFAQPCREFFRYSAPDETILCLTCLPTRTRPSGGPTLSPNPTSQLVPGLAIRNLSADGSRFFFESPDALVSGDTNGVIDVYEWEAKGTGSCKSESQNGGCIYLISSGTDPERSAFLGSSKNGDHAFFFTEQQLVPTDQDRLIDVYDAGVGAGLSAQHELAPPTCASAACQANPAPPPDPNLASAAYSGAGNAHRAAKGRKCPKGTRKVRAKGKVGCRRAHKQHKRHNNRGGSK
jgi:hypothetical protein